MARTTFTAALGLLLIASMGLADARVAEDRYLSGYANTCSLGSYGSVHALAGFGDDVLDAALILLIGEDDGIEPEVPDAIPDAPLVPDGACFRVLPSERTATITLVGDDTQPRAFWYGLTMGTSLIGSDVVCGDSADIALPPGVDMLSIVVYTTGACGLDSKATTTGTVTVAFT